MGLQLIGKPFDEATLFRAGYMIEDAAGRFPVPQMWWAWILGLNCETRARHPRSSILKRHSHGREP